MGIKNIIGELQVNGEKVDTKLLSQVVNALIRQRVILPFYINEELVFAPINIGDFGLVNGAIGSAWSTFCTYENDTPYNFIHGSPDDSGIPLVIAQHKITQEQYHVKVSSVGTLIHVSDYIQPNIHYVLEAISE